MFGSLYRMSVKPGKKDELVRVMTDVGDRKIKGMRSAYIYDTGGSELWGVAVFDDEKTYRDNAADPAQDEWYRGVRDLLTADPEWHDGAIVPWPGNRG
jgi:hypothetical protein